MYITLFTNQYRLDGTITCIYKEKKKKIQRILLINILLFDCSQIYRIYRVYIRHIHSRFI
jgi:hypothetical protein